MIDGNNLLSEFVGKNWMVLVLAYGLIRGIFPNSKILTAIGEAFSGMFPSLKK